MKTTAAQLVWVLFFSSPHFCFLLLSFQSSRQILFSSLSKAVRSGLGGDVDRHGFNCCSGARGCFVAVLMCRWWLWCDLRSHGCLGLMDQNKGAAIGIAILAVNSCEFEKLQVMFELDGGGFD
jgi:hypothetical protein